MEQLTPSVARLRVSIANVYFAGKPGAPWTLVDAGVPGHAERIGEAAERRYGPGARPHAILLTHGHFDHAGSVLELADRWNVPVYAHRLERPFLTGKSAYPPKDPMAGGAMAFLSRFFPSSTVDASRCLRDLPEGEVPGLPDWRWIHTPGHAPGHVAFYHAGESVLLAGDACATMDLDSAWGMLTQERRVSRPPAPFTFDWDEARRSVEILAELRPRALGCGHGEPMAGSAVAAGLDDLARNFPRPQGRYAVEPARTDENGIVFMPPPVPDPLPGVALTAGLSALTVAAVVSAARHRWR